jgi:hypothetical protein
MIARTATLLALTAAVALAGCAKVGTLDRPAPLFGEKAKEHYRAEQAAAAAAKAKKAEDDQPEALPAEAPPVNQATQPVQQPAPDSPNLPPAAPQ